MQFSSLIPQISPREYSMIIYFLLALLKLLLRRSLSAFKTVRISSSLSRMLACKNRCLILLKSSWQEVFTFALYCFLSAILSELSQKYVWRYQASLRDLHTCKNFYQREKFSQPRSFPQRFLKRMTRIFLKAWFCPI